MVNAEIAVRNIHNTNVCLSLTNIKRLKQRFETLKDVSAENLRPSSEDSRPKRLFKSFKTFFKTLDVSQRQTNICVITLWSLLIFGRFT